MADILLCDFKKRFLFEARPDIFPPRLTPLEREIWARYYEDKNRKSR